MIAMRLAMRCRRCHGSRCVRPLTQCLASMSLPEHRFYACFLCGGTQVAVEGLFSSDQNFGIKGDTLFKDVQGKRVFFVDSATKKLQHDADGIPRLSSARISSMPLPGGKLADMATRAREAIQPHGGIELVLGGPLAISRAATNAEMAPGVDLDAMELPPTPPTPESGVSDGSW